MKRTLTLIFALISICLFAQAKADKISYHKIRLDAAGKILPWYSDDLGESYDRVINLVWGFWEKMRVDSNGAPYYLNHQVWKRDSNDQRGIGGDQVAMALSSWRLLYAYGGNRKVLDNMILIADYYLSHSLSPANADWPNIPYPYNTVVQSGVYDGDMILGKDYTQPDKAGSFGYELVNMYKITGDEKYINAAVKIASTLSAHVAPGGEFQSPLPFRVNAITGQVGVLKDKDQVEKVKYNYTSNWVPTMLLFRELANLDMGNADEYRKSYRTILNWMKAYPLKNNKWGPFFEDVGLWSNTQINAITFAEFILENRDEFPNWKQDSFSAIDWVYDELYNEKWDKYGAAVVNEQTHYQVPGNSHTARQGAVELLYALCAGDSLRRGVGLKQLNWATYMVNDDGENTYPNNETWLTDGYGDYVRHYLKAFAAFPEITPLNQNHIVKSKSVITSVIYGSKSIQYTTFDGGSTEILRVKTKPKSVKADGKKLNELKTSAHKEGWKWEPEKKGGVLIITHLKGKNVNVRF
jgi:hypothetical protein